MEQVCIIIDIMTSSCSPSHTHKILYVFDDFINLEVQMYISIPLELTKIKKIACPEQY